ncbi:MAG: hypothetical protein Kow0062_25830 [Acidobacteriota bacterium]
MPSVRIPFVAMLIASCPGFVLALAPHEAGSALDARVRRLPPAAVETVPADDPRAPADAFAAFVAREGGTWWGRLEAGSGRAVLLSGSGLALPAGSGASLEDAVRALVARHPRLLGPRQGRLVLSPRRSQVLDGGRLVYVDFDLAIGERRVRGARVFARIRNGRVIQLGTHLAGGEAEALEPALDRDDAWRALWRHVGGRTELDRPFGEPTLVYLPVDEGGALRYRLVWELAFRRAGGVETWTARVDALSGAVLEFFDANAYEGAVTGGVLPRTVVDPEIELPLPFVQVDGAGVTDAAGQFTFSGGTVSSGLDGRWFSTSCEACTNPAQAHAETDIGLGLLRFGTGGSDGTGNGISTRAERVSFFHLNLVRMLAKKWLDVPWLDTTIRSNVNIQDTCNAFYNGSVNFYRSGGGCNNTGEIADVVQHEWGHGIDNNTLGGDSATGEGTGDHVAFIFQRDPVIGPYFRTSGAGVRNVDRLSNSRGLLTRDNVGSKCSPAGTGCGGPLGYECHCEGEIYGQAGWDLAQALVGKYGFQTGWLAYERIFYESLPQAGGYLPEDANAIYDAYLAVDDDDGNLANGTPNGQEIFDAFDLHGIAGAPVGSSPHCARPAEPTVSATADCAGITLSWDAVPGATSYRVMKNWLGPERAFLPLAETGATSVVDGEVRPGVTYHYLVQAVDASGCTSTVETVTTLDGPARPVLSVKAVRFDDTPRGNRSGTVDPGESVDLFFTLENAADVPASAIVGTLATATPGVTVEIDTQPFPDSAGLDEVVNGASFRIAIDETVPCGSTIDLELTVTDASGCSAPAQPVPLRVGVDELRTADTFDTDNGWTFDAASSTATTGDWTRGVPDGTAWQPGADSDDDGTACWFTAPNGGGDGTDDVDDGEVVLLSPVFDLSGLAEADLSYQRWFGNRDVGEDPDDFFWVEASSDGGASWVTVEKLDTNVSAANWTKVTADLDALIPLTDQVRFRVRVSDGTLDGNLIEGGFDDFRITEPTCDTTPPCFVPPTFAGLDSATPGPDCAEVQLAWSPASSNCENATISYQVYRSTDPAFTPSDATRIAGGITGLSYQDTLLEPGVDYHYVVRAYDSRSGEDGNLERRTATAPTAPDTKAPLFDGVASVIEGDNCGEVRLSWQAARETCSTPVVYRVYRSTTPGFAPAPENLVAETTDIGFVDAALDPTVDYHYVVRAVDAAQLEDGNTVEGSAPAKVLEELLSVEDFEAGDAGWSRTGTNDATTGLWERGDPDQTDAQPGDCPSGTNCWATGLAGPGLGDNDVDGGTTTLWSAPFDLTGLIAPAIRYKRYYSNNTGSTPGTDTWTVEISNDDGASWTTVESTQQSDEGMVFSQITFPLEGAIAPSATMRCRFIASDLGDGSIVEAVVDDFETLDLEGGCDGCPAPPAVGTILVSRDADDVLLDWSADPVTAARYKVYTLAGPGFADATLLGTTASKGYRHLEGARFAGLTAYRVSAVDSCGQEGPLP